ncbi:hypothetical protein GYA44_03065 [Candidatus Microgenomates bacterium]|nr:hypothetical protein [Candidatus Microgenomates bacterium]
MTIGRMVTILGIGILIGLVAGIITRNLFVAFAFPFLLFAFFLIWKSYKQDIKVGNIKVEEEEKEEHNDSTYNRPTEV